MREIYDIANDVELACQSESCQRDDCNGFICRNAIDAAILAERKRCAAVARHLNGWGPVGGNVVAEHIAKMIEVGQ